MVECTSMHGSMAAGRRQGSRGLAGQSRVHGGVKKSAQGASGRMEVESFLSGLDRCLGE